MGKEPIYRCSQPGHSDACTQPAPFRCWIHQVWNFAPTCCGKPMQVRASDSIAAGLKPAHRCVGCAAVVVHDQNHVGVACDVPGCIRYETGQGRGWVVADDVTEGKPQPDKKAALEWYTKTLGSGVFGNASILVPPRHAKTEAVRGLFEVRAQIEAAENDLRLNYGQGAVDEAKKMALTSGLTYADALTRTIIKRGTENADFYHRMVDPTNAAKLAHEAIKDMTDRYVRQLGVPYYPQSQTMSQIPKETPVEFGPYEIKFEHTEKSREDMARLSKELREAASKSPQLIDVRKDHPKPPKNNFVSWNLTADVHIKDLNGTLNVKGPAQIMIGMASVDALDLKYGDHTLRQLLEIDEAARQDRNVKDPSAPGGWVKAVVLRKAFTQQQRDAVSAYLSAQLRVKVQASEAQRKSRETTVVVGDDEMWLSNCKDVD